MKIKNAVIVLILFININLFSQNFLEYYKVINKAEIATLDEKFIRSDSLYQIAFNLVEKPFKEDYYLAAMNADNLKNDPKVYNYLEKGIENGLILKRVKKLKNFVRSKLYRTLKRNYKSLQNKHFQTLNIPLRNEIVEMIKNDQKARFLGGWRKMKKADSYNYKRLVEIIKENGDKWPGFSTIGEITPGGKYDVTDNIALMLLHFKSEEINFLQPFMLKAVMEGEMYPYHFARIIDYKYFSKSGTNIIKKNTGEKRKEKDHFSSCQLYGTFKNVMINNCKNAEEERKKIGFESLDDYYRKRNCSYSCKDD